MQFSLQVFKSTMMQKQYTLSRNVVSSIEFLSSPELANLSIILSCEARQQQEHDFAQPHANESVLVLFKAGWAKW